ncbi:MAG: WD40 repeat domain-containing protein, partial [Cyanobacteria bacterium P01_D01_bin.44]
WKITPQQEPTLTHTLRGHRKGVYRVSFSPRDDMLATGGADGLIRLWLRDKGTLVDTLEGHEDEILSLAFSPQALSSGTTSDTSVYSNHPLISSNHILASASIDGNIRLWNMDSPVQPLPHNNRVFDVVFRPDGVMVASSGLSTIRLWRRDGTLRSHLEYERGTDVLALDYNPNGDLLAAGGDNGQIQIWKPDVKTHEPVQKLEDAHPVAKSTSVEQGVTDLSFSPDGRWLASAGADSTLKLWRRVDEGDQLYRYLTLQHPADVTGVSFSADQRFLITSTLAQPPRGQGAGGEPSGLITLWPMPDRGNPNSLPARALEFSQNHHSGDILTISVSPTEKPIIASGGEDGKIILWDLTGNALKTLRGHADTVTQVDFSQDGLFLVSSSRDGTVRLWTIHGDLISVLDRHNREVSSVAFGPEGGETLASASFDNDVLLWRLWNLPDLAITASNERRVILQTLIKMGCASAQTYLADQATDSQGELSPDEQEFSNDIKEVKKFCRGYLDKAISSGS